MSDFIVNVTPENAQQVLIEGSMNQPVLIDFWADWCAPCKVLMPVLEKLCTEYQGAFTLAKVNCDEQQHIAAQFGVKSLPTVMLMVNGQPVDGFAGAQTETFIRDMLDKHLPKPWHDALSRCQQLIAAGELSEALPLARNAAVESNNALEALKILAHIYIALNRINEAKEILSLFKMADQDAVFEQLKAALDLKVNAAKSPATAQLEQAAAEQPENLEIQLQLAIHYNEVGHHEEAMQKLLAILRADKEFHNGEAKKTLLDIFKTLGNQDPLVIKYQRQLFSLLY